MQEHLVARHEQQQHFGLGKPQSVEDCVHALSVKPGRPFMLPPMKLPSITTVTGISAGLVSRCISDGVRGLFAALGSTVMVPFVSMMAYSTSEGLKQPLPRRASSRSSTFMLSSFSTSGSRLPFSMTTIGLPFRSFLRRRLPEASLVMMMCTRNSEKTGIMP